MSHKREVDDLAAAGPLSQRLLAFELPAEPASQLGTVSTAGQCLDRRKLNRSRRSNKVVYILGVAHVSARSVREAAELVEAVKPTAVLLELCAERQSLARPQTWPPPPMTELGVAIRSGQVEQLLSPTFWLIGLPLRALEVLAGSPIGAEQASAAAAGRHVGAKVMAIDRLQSVTIARAFAALVDVALQPATWMSAAEAAKRALQLCFRDVCRRYISESELKVPKQGQPTANDARPSPALLDQTVELGMLLARHASTLSNDELHRAQFLARLVVDSLLGTPPAFEDVGAGECIDACHEKSGQVLGKVMDVIGTERDFVLAHSIWHVASALPPGSSAVAVLGAAHLAGVRQLLSDTSGARSFGGCSLSAPQSIIDGEYTIHSGKYQLYSPCGCATRLAELNERPTATLFAAAGGLITLSLVTGGIRLLTIRRLRAAGECYFGNASFDWHAALVDSQLLPSSNHAQIGLVSVSGVAVHFFVEYVSPAA
eukprot:SAG31_NODE_634_length_13365_cov_182.161767_2_plen_486_part_00